MPERQEERVLSSAQLTLVKAQARRIAREELAAATGIGELVRQMVEDEVSALRSSGKLNPDRAQAAQVSKIVDDLKLSKLQDRSGKEMYTPALPSSNAEEQTHHRREVGTRC